MTSDGFSASPAEGDNEDGDDPYQPPRTRREKLLDKFLRSKRAWLVYGVIAALVVTGVVVKVVYFPPSCPGSLAPADDGNPHDCVGLTDGHYVFNPALASVEAKILAENNDVNKLAAAQHQPWVAIAYLLPMTLSEGSTQTLETVARQLTGAYIAQWEANHNSGMADGNAPLIKLYLVNEGANEARWQFAVGQIIAATSNSLNVVAVAGLGTSIVATRQGAAEMSKAELAMFGTAITADDLNGSEHSSLVRIAPTNDDEVRAALQFLPQVQGGGKTAMLVRDMNTSDDYVTNWGNDVAADYRGAEGKLLGPNVTFDSSSSAVNSVLVNDAGYVCQDHPEVVFFAGRAQQLEIFVGALYATCTTPVTVISGDDDVIDSNTSTDPQDYTSFTEALNNGVSLYSTELAAAQEWSACGTVPQSQALAVRTFNQFQLDYHQLLGGQFAAITDPSDAMLARDAVITAATVIRRSKVQSAGKSQYQQVMQYFGGLDFDKVAGVSGIIQIGNFSTTKGNTVNKPLVIMQHLGSGAEQCKAIETP